MFARIKKSGAQQYLQLVENRREGKKTLQRVVATIGRLDQLQAKNDIEHLIRSLSRFSEKVLLVLSGQHPVEASAHMIGPALIFERLWEQLGLRKILQHLVAGRKFGFEVERAIFLTVLHRLFPSGSDRFCDHWRRDYRIAGTERLSLHHLYRAMAFLGEAVGDQRGDSTLSSADADSYLSTEWLVKIVKDFKRTVDYLETRPDIDATKLAYFGFSWGGYMGAIIPAVENRLKASILAVGAINGLGRPEARDINYVSRVTTPTLMLNGRYDMASPYESAVKPMFDLLGTPKEHKELKLFETDHFIPRNEFIKETLRWLDQYLGPVRSQ